MKGVCDYGRYNDDPEHVGCPRAKTDMTPCIARDGCSALSDALNCVACQCSPSVLLMKLFEAGVDRRPIRLNPHGAADQLRDVVREATERLT